MPRTGWFSSAASAERDDLHARHVEQDVEDGVADREREEVVVAGQHALVVARGRRTATCRPTSQSVRLRKSEARNGQAVKTMKPISQGLMNAQPIRSMRVIRRRRRGDPGGRRGAPDARSSYATPHWARFFSGSFGTVNLNGCLALPKLTTSLAFLLASRSASSSFFLSR